MIFAFMADIARTVMWHMRPCEGWAGWVCFIRFEHPTVHMETILLVYWCGMGGMVFGAAVMT